MGTLIRSVPPGDISFRFLDYVSFQRGRKERQAARANQTLTWQQINDSYAPGEPGRAGSRAVVCDINKEMLKVGKQRGEELGYGTGTTAQVEHRYHSTGRA